MRTVTTKNTTCPNCGGLKLKWSNVCGKCYFPGRKYPPTRAVIVRAAQEAVTAWVRWTLLGQEDPDAYAPLGDAMDRLFQMVGEAK